MAQSKAKRVFLQNDLTVQMPVSEAYPQGGVRKLKAGYNELDAELENHPLISRIVTQSEADQDYQEACWEADRERDEAIGEAHADHAKAMMKAREAFDKARAKETEEHMKRREEADKKGVVFNEPHPDPDAARAQALTAEPAHTYPTAMFETKDDAAGHQAGEVKPHAEQKAETAQERRERTKA